MDGELQREGTTGSRKCHRAKRMTVVLGWNKPRRIARISEKDFEGA